MIAARRVARLRAWLREHLPAGLLYRPDEILIAVMCLMSGLGALIGEIEVGSVHDLLPDVVYRGWGALLLIGGLALLVGIASMRRVPHGYTILAAPVYRLGQRLLFNGGLVYAACVLTVAGWQVFVALLLLFSIARGVHLLNLSDSGGRREPD